MTPEEQFEENMNNSGPKYVNKLVCEVLLMQLSDHFPVIRKPVPDNDNWQLIAMTTPKGVLTIDCHFKQEGKWSYMISIQGMGSFLTGNEIAAAEKFLVMLNGTLVEYCIELTRSPSYKWRCKGE